MVKTKDKLGNGVRKKRLFHGVFFIVILPLFILSVVLALVISSWS